MKILPLKVKREVYQNTFWHFSLDLRNQWYEPQGLLWWIHRIPASTIQNPVFRHERLPIQANIVIGDLPNIPSWQEQHQFARQHYGEIPFTSESSIEVLGQEHYTVTFNLVRVFPTKKYSIVLMHPQRNIPIEFVFTVSVYDPVEFEKLIELGDNLVRSFRWLGH